MREIGKLAMGYRSVRALRWIDFSEDDAFSRGRANRMTPREVHVFEKKFKFLSKKMLTRFRAFN